MSGALFEADVRLRLREFELAVAVRGERQVTGIFGPSGCGKTSLLECLCGLRRGVEGRIAVNGHVWLDTRARVSVAPEHRRVGYVPQDVLLFPNLDVRGNLRAGAARPGRNAVELRVTFERVVELLELGALLDHGVDTLSGGERQRVALGRALCSGPRLLLLDEPLAALDLRLRRKVLPFLALIRREFAIPMFLVSHDPTEVQALCDELYVMQAGRIIAQGPPSAVLVRPEVFGLAGRAAFENVLPCILRKSEGEASVVSLGLSPGGPTLSVFARSAGIGTEKLLSIPAHDIIIAIAPPHGLSARNILPARIEAIHQFGSLRVVKAAVGFGLPSLAVEVSEDGHTALRLAPGRAIDLVIKATSCTLLDERGMDLSLSLGRGLNRRVI
jgi:molybdate transport system ATP-binding protein